MKNHKTMKGVLRHKKTGITIDLKDWETVEGQEPLFKEQKDKNVYLDKNHPCHDKGHSFFLVTEIDNGRSKYGEHKCGRCGIVEPFQYDYN